MLIPFLGLRTNSLFLSTWWEFAPPNRQGEGRDLRTGLCFIAKRPLSGRLAALLTGSRADEFISDAAYGRAQLEIGDGYR
jgi:hypothetical protein